MNKNIAGFNGIISPDDTAVSVVSFDTSVGHESSGDFTLPDYLPEIRRVISVSSNVLPEGRFINGDSSSQNVTIEFAGSVVHNVLYTNETGELYSASLSTDYESNTAAPSSVNSVFVDTRLESGAACRVTAPRRLAIKTKLKSRVIAVNEKFLNETMESPLTAADELSIERLYKKCDTVKILRGELGDLRVSETVDAPGGLQRPASCWATVCVKDVKPQHDVLSVRGDIIVKCICAPENNDSESVSNEAPETVIKKIPFSEDIEIDGLTDKYSARAWGRCTSVTVTGDDSEGDSGSGSLLCDLVFELDAEAMTNDTVTTTADMYSTACECACTYKDADVYSVVRCGNGNISLSGSSSKQDKNASVLCNSTGDVRVDKVECEKGKIVVSATCMVKALLANVRGEKGTELSSEEVSIPFRYECDANINGNPDIVWRCDCAVTDISGRADGDSVTVNPEVSVSVSALAKNRIHILDHASLDRSKKNSDIKKDAEMKIYYPQSNDTLWKIAKDNGITCRAIAELNGIEVSQMMRNDVPASLDGISMLVIL